MAVDPQMAELAQPPLVRQAVAPREEDRRRKDELWRKISTLEKQLGELEEKSARTMPLLRRLGRRYGFGVAGKIAWVRFKLDYLREEWARLEALQTA